MSEDNLFEGLEGKMIGIDFSKLQKEGELSYEWKESMRQFDEHSASLDEYHRRKEAESRRMANNVISGRAPYDDGHYPIICN